MSAIQAPPARHRRRDKRLPGIILAVAGTALLGYLVTLMPAQQTLQPAKQRLEAETPTVAAEAPLYPAPKPGEELADIDERLLMGEAKQLLEAAEFDAAFEQLNRNRERLKHRPEALVLMGEALLERDDPTTAMDFFNSALDRNPQLADAYFGFARAAEALGELELALGGMRSYLHLQDDPYRLRAGQARSAIWEWEAKLKRGPWGPTQGIPPGFTADELKRDDRGVGTKMPIPGTENEDGNSRYEIRHSDKFELFEP